MYQKVSGNFFNVLIFLEGYKFSFFSTNSFVEKELEVIHLGKYLLFFNFLTYNSMSHKGEDNEFLFFKDRNSFLFLPVKEYEILSKDFFFREDLFLYFFCKQFNFFYFFNKRKKDLSVRGSL